MDTILFHFLSLSHTHTTSAALMRFSSRVSEQIMVQFSSLKDTWSWHITADDCCKDQACDVSAGEPHWWESGSRLSGAPGWTGALLQRAHWNNFEAVQYVVSAVLSRDPVLVLKQSLGEIYKTLNNSFSIIRERSRSTIFTIWQSFVFFLHRLKQILQRRFQVKDGNWMDQPLGMCLLID